MMNDLKIKTIEEFQREGISPEILFWVGCAGSFDDRAKRITKAFVKILNSANISSVSYTHLTLPTNREV